MDKMKEEAEVLAAEVSAKFPAASQKLSHLNLSNLKEMKNELKENFLVRHRESSLKIKLENIWGNILIVWEDLKCKVIPIKKRILEKGILHFMEPLLCSRIRCGAAGFIIGIAFGYLVTRRSQRGSLIKPDKMKGILCHANGEIFTVTDLKCPLINDPNEILIQVSSVSLDYHDLKVKSGISIPGRSCSGIIKQVGVNVNKFEIGDHVWAAKDSAESGTLCQFITMNQNGSVGKKPHEINFQGASAVPYSGLITYDALIKVGLLCQPFLDVEVLIMDGTSSSGCLALQFLRSSVRRISVSVNSRRLSPIVEMLEADLVLQREDLMAEMANNVQKYDIIIYTCENADFTAKEIQKSLLKPYSGKFINLAVGRNNKLDSKYLDDIYNCVKNGALQPVLDSTFDFDESDEAFRKLSTKLIVGKIVINMN